MTNVTYKYESTVIGLIRRGTQLEIDLLTQIREIFKNMKSLTAFMNEMEKFFEAAGASLSPGGDPDAEP